MGRCRASFTLPKDPTPISLMKENSLVLSNSRFDTTLSLIEIADLLLFQCQAKESSSLNQDTIAYDYIKKIEGLNAEYVLREKTFLL